MSKSIKKKEILKLLNNKKIKNILFISGINSFYKLKVKKYFKSILKNKNKFYFLKKSHLPEINELKKIMKFKEKVKPDFIIAIGGGSTLDYAKIACSFKFSKKLTKKIIKSDIDLDVRKKIKLLAIPTTAGSGAEITSNSVLYIKKKKYSVEDKVIQPNYFFLEPRFLKSTSLQIDGSSGFDAISQAVESMFSLKSTKTSFNYSQRALKILLRNFKNFIQRKNLANSYQMAIGANLAGKAINISKTTLPHAISYPITSNYHVPHGHAVSLTFNKALKFNYFNMDKSLANFSLKKRFITLFKLTNTKNIYDLDNYFLRIKQIASLEQNFSKLGINLKKDLSNILFGVNKQRLKNNPVKIKKKNVVDILKNI